MQVISRHAPRKEFAFGASNRLLLHTSPLAHSFAGLYSVRDFYSTATYSPRPAKYASQQQQQNADDTVP